MGEHINQFCEELRVKLTTVENNVKDLKKKIDGKAQTAEKDALAGLSTFRTDIERGRAKVAAAQEEIKKWADEQKNTAREKVAEWKAKHERAKLQHRAESAERYAKAAMVVALSAVDEAAHAALEAWLARADAEGAEGSKAA
jgi:predicted  nucleic acid-binding Zn-ribbon protein